MRYFEFDKHSYYALIVATDEEDAILEYNNEVADFYTHDDDPPSEITMEEAKEKVIDAALKDGLTREDAEREWKATRKRGVLLIDGSLA